MDFATTLETIATFMEEQEIRFALVGGLALAAYGFPRATLDLDFVVERKDQDSIIAFMESLGYKTLHRSQGYSNHTHGDPALGRVDFIYVGEATGEQVFTAAKRMAGPAGRMVPVPKAEHLIAMKVLAIKNDPERVFQELADIRNLMLQPDIDREMVREYFRKHDLEERFDELEQTF